MKKRFQTEWWQEYPNRDVEFVRFYPCDIKLIKNPEEIWRPKEIVCYVHIPFCKAMCTYCGYNKYLWNALRANDYLPFLEKEIEMYAGKPYVQNCRVVALYFGGGTPTCLSTKQLRRLLGLIKRSFQFSKDAELCTEANPETVNKERLEELIEGGFNRISFGFQSFDDGVLKILNRRHTAARAIEMFNLAKTLGYQNVGIDLMYRLPGQTLAHWKNEINKAIQ